MITVCQRCGVRVPTRSKSDTCGERECADRAKSKAPRHDRLIEYRIHSARPTLDRILDRWDALRAERGDT